jgi:hypothetical protein
MFLRSAAASMQGWMPSAGPLATLSPAMLRRAIPSIIVRDLI